MADRVRLILLILAVPAIGIAASIAIRGHLNSELRDAALRQVPAADRDDLRALTVARACERGLDAPELCQADAQLAWLTAASGAAALVGLVLLGGIAVAGRAARSNRELLLSVFRPGLHLTAVVVTGLILAHAVIAIAVIYFGESALTNRVHFGIILAIGLGALYGVGAVARSAFRLMQKADAMAIGRVVSPQDAPGLWRQTEDAARRLGALMPDQIVVGLDPTFYVTEANVTTLDGPVSGRTLFCSLPLARILTVGEFTAILGHELGHFRGEDTRFSSHFYPIYRGTAMSIVSLETAGGSGWGQVALVPAIAMFSYFLDRFAVAESLHSRTRELLADRAGAEASSDRTMAAALVKVHAFSGIWSSFQTAALDALKQGKIFLNASAVFADAVSTHATPEALEGLADAQTSHPTDSHPPLGVRLEALSVEMSSVAADALSVRPTESAATLVPNCDEREAALSQDYQLLLASQFGIRLEPTTEAGKAALQSSPIRECWSCGTRVLPTRKNTCPSCGEEMLPQK